MEFSIQKADFLRGLRLAQGIADRKSTMPILANVLLRTDGKQRLLVAATDLNVAVSAELPAKIEKEGALTVAAKMLHDIVADLPGEDVKGKRSENLWAEIRCGSFESKLVGMADRDFPKLPEPGKIKYAKFDAPTLREMIDKTLFSVSNDETRFQLSGVLFECDGKTARMVSTDGHRLSKIERAVSEGPKLERGVIIPKKGLGELKRAVDGLGGACEIAVSGGAIYLKSGDVGLSVKLIEAEFPPYEQVIPAPNPVGALVPREALMAALKRTSHMTSDKTSGVKLLLADNVLKIISDNPDLGEAREELKVDYAGAPLTIGFNSNYFKELLSHMSGDRVRLELSGELDPGVVRGEASADYLGVIMPMRI